jgi:hypothetical protein
MFAQVEAAGLGPLAVVPTLVRRTAALVLLLLYCLLVLLAVTGLIDRFTAAWGAAD